MPNNALPLVLSIVICDQAIVDPSTGKRSLMGCFGGIGAKTFPAIHPQIHVAVAITSCHGLTAIKLKIVRVTPDSLDGEELVGAETQVDVPDPRMILEFGIDFRNVTFPAPGEYRVALESQGIVVLERRVVVTQV